MKRYSLKTLGCKANLYDSQLIEHELQNRGWVRAEPHENADICLVNSCTVTDEADRQSRRIAQKASANGHTRVVMTGCGAEVDPQKYASTPGVHYVVGNQDKSRIVDLVVKAIEGEEARPMRPGSRSEAPFLGGVVPYSEIRSRHPMDREWASSESTFLSPPAHLRGDSGRVRGFLKVQEGCNAFCTYCIIPYGRGPSRSPSIEFIVEQVRSLCTQGIREVILTGTNIGDFGTDWKPDIGGNGKTQLERLVSEILERTVIERVRIGSLDPMEISPELRSLFNSNPRLCAHFHVSLQSPHSKILRLMKRKYGWDEVESSLEAISTLSAPVGGVFIGMDMITGFPGEGEEEFETSFKRLKSLPWSRLHVFPYSEREGTPATRLPGSVYPHVRAERAKRLRELSLERMKSIHHSIIDECSRTRRRLDRVLFEGVSKGPDPSQNYVGGYTSNYFRVLVSVPSGADIETLKNQIHSVLPESLVVDASQGDAAFLGRL